MDAKLLDVRRLDAWSGLFSKIIDWLCGFPPGFDTDEIYPVHPFDDTNDKANRKLLSWTLRFDDLFDADQLHYSLVKLIDRPGWRKMGGRLRADSEGKLSIHVPEKFIFNSPAVRFSHDDYDIGIEEEPRVWKLPRSIEPTPSLHEGPPVFRYITTRLGQPMKFADHLKANEPLISLHIASFTDATLVAITWPQTAADMMGMHGLMHAWARVLSGNEQDVPGLMGVHKDPLRALGRLKLKQRYVLAGTQLKGLDVLRRVWQTVVDMWTWPRMESKTICLPAQALVKLKHEAGVTSRESVESYFDQRPFLSENDVLTSWLARQACSVLPPDSKRPVTISIPFEGRSRLPDFFPQPSLFEQDDGTDMRPSPVYIGNATFAATIHIPSLIVRNNGGLADVATARRSAINTQTTKAQIKAAASETRRRTERRRGGVLVTRLPRPQVYAPADSFTMTVSRWSKMNVVDDFDFSPAVINPRVGVATRSMTSVKAGRPTYNHADVLDSGFAERNSFFVSGKDRCGNTWITGNMPPAA